MPTFSTWQFLILDARDTLSTVIVVVVAVAMAVVVVVQSPVCLSCCTTLWQQQCVNLTPPSNSLQHNKLLQRGRGISLLPCETSDLWKRSVFQDWSKGKFFSPRCPSSNHTSWFLTKSEGPGSHKTLRRTTDTYRPTDCSYVVSLWQQWCVTVYLQRETFFSFGHSALPQHAAYFHE